MSKHPGLKICVELAGGPEGTANVMHGDSAWIAEHLMKVHGVGEGEWVDLAEHFDPDGSTGLRIRLAPILQDGLYEVPDDISSMEV